MQAVKGRENEREFYREIIRRAKRVREHAVESLGPSRPLRKSQGGSGAQSDPTQRPRRFRRQG